MNAVHHIGRFWYTVSGAKRRRFARNSVWAFTLMCRFPALSADALNATLYGNVTWRYTEIGLL
jgi:uncharacterized membrane protein YdjX (TVP38/TMEM64 family)